VPLILIPLYPCVSIDEEGGGGGGGAGGVSGVQQPGDLTELSDTFDHKHIARLGRTDTQQLQNLSRASCSIRGYIYTF
jgi:hypothetical protein